MKKDIDLNDIYQELYKISSDYFIFPRPQRSKIRIMIFYEFII